MRKSKKFLAVIMALIMIVTAIPMMTASADAGGWGDIFGGDDEDKHEHVYVIQGTKEGSCTEAASTTFKCSCGDVQVMTTGDPSHTPAENGYVREDDKFHSNYCTVCKKLYKEEHDYYMVDYVSPTCEKSGKEVYECFECGGKKTVTLDPSVHIPSGKVVSDDDKHGFTCFACEKLINEEHVWDEGVAENVACGDKGKIIYTCLVPGCNKTKEETVPAACVYPDKEDIEDGFAPKVNKYDENGHTFECIYCSKDKSEAHEFVVEYTYDVEVISSKMVKAAAVAEPVSEEPSSEPVTDEPTSDEPTEHECSWSEWKTIVNVSCGHDGYQTRYCTVCGDIESKNIPATGKHNYEWIMVYEPSVGNPGKEIYQCTECRDIAEEQYIVITLNTPTCQEEGEVLVSCKYCNYSYTAAVDTVDHKIAEDAEYKEFSKDHHKTTCEYCGEVKLPHNWGEWKVVEAATADKEGKKSRECADCGQVENAKIDKGVAILGDVNGTDGITAIDARLILQHVAGLRTLTAKEQEAADMNKDGNITALDAREILQIVAGLKK